MEEKEVERVELYKVEYTQPKFWHRIMANLVDILLFAFTGVLLFISVNSIVNATTPYKAMEKRYDEIRLDSGLYVKNSKEEVEYLPSFLDNDKSDVYTYKYRLNDFMIPTIEVNFPNYLKTNASLEAYELYLKTYDEYRLSIKTSSGISYFVKDGEDIIVNSDYFIDSNYKDYYRNVYVPFMDTTCLGYLNSYVGEFYKINKDFSKVLFFIEVPSALTLSAILVYFVPPLFFRKGRQTLGKALYHIGLVDQRLLSPTFGRFCARFAIFFFAEVALSIFTMGLPLIISFSMMVFTKYKQGFPDYMLRLVEIDKSKRKIYMSYLDAELDNIPTYKSPVDFKMEKDL